MGHPRWRTDSHRRGACHRTLQGRNGPVHVRSTPLHVDPPRGCDDRCGRLRQRGSARSRRSRHGRAAVDDRSWRPDFSPRHSSRRGCMDGGNRASVVSRPALSRSASSRRVAVHKRRLRTGSAGERGPRCASSRPAHRPTGGLSGIGHRLASKRSRRRCLIDRSLCHGT